MATITYLTTIHFDFGALQLVGSETERLGIRRPFLVTGRGVRAAGLLERLPGALALSKPPAVFDETPQNPTEDAVIAATRIYQSSRCDGIIAHATNPREATAADYLRILRESF